ncbi:MAG: aminopeptidase, partial [Solirubrobacteraceae bacterium]
MTPDPAAFAALLCDWSMEVRPGDRVGILSTTLAAELASALHRAVLQRDAWPFVSLEPPGLAADLYRHGRERHRAEPPPTQMAVAGALDAFVRV